MILRWLAVVVATSVFLAAGLVAAFEIAHYFETKEVDEIITESRFEEQRQSEAMMKQEELAKKACPEAAVILPNRFICVPYINSAK